MSENRANTADPRLLLEAARVFNAAGPNYKSIAEVVAESALQAREKADDPKVREAIIGDAVALRLSGRVPGGYPAALELVKEIQEDSDGRLHLLRALANGQNYRAAKARNPKEDPELSELRRQICRDLEIAFSKNERLRAANQRFWLPDPADSAAGDREDDLSDVYKDDPEFRILVDPLRSLAFASTESATRIAAWLYSGGKVNQPNYDALQMWLNKQPETFLNAKDYPSAAFVSGDTPMGDLEPIRQRALNEKELDLPPT